MAIGGRPGGGGQFRPGHEEEPPETIPPSLRMTQLVATDGFYPHPEANGAMMTMGMIRSFAGRHRPFGVPVAAGQVMPLRSYPVLFSIAGTSFGGDGHSTFKLPDLVGRAAVGGGPEGGAAEGGASVPINWLIAVAGEPPRPQGPPSMIGALAMFMGKRPAGGWLPADGRALAIAEHRALFEVIGTRFGAEGRDRFRLPDLRGRTPVGSDADGLGTVCATEGVQGLRLQLLISNGGVFPANEGSGQRMPDEGSFFGEVVAFAGAAAPEGWLALDGRTLSAGDHMPLCASLGDEGRGNMFALPDLRGKMIVGREQ